MKQINDNMNERRLNISHVTLHFVSPLSVGGCVYTCVWPGGFVQNVDLILSSAMFERLLSGVVFICRSPQQFFFLLRATIRRRELSYVSISRGYHGHRPNQTPPVHLVSLMIWCEIEYKTILNIS